jgi:hypothetical protein
MGNCFVLCWRQCNRGKLLSCRLIGIPAPHAMHTTPRMLDGGLDCRSPSAALHILLPFVFKKRIFLRLPIGGPTFQFLNTRLSLGTHPY